MHASAPNASANERTSQQLALTTTAVWIALVITGIYLAFFGRPVAAAAYEDMERLRSDFTLALWIRWGHKALTVVAAALTMAMLVRRLQKEHWRAAMLLAGLAIATLSLWLTGRYLPMDQIALWNVTSGTNIIGFEPVFGDANETFNLADGSEISMGSIRFWFQVHTLLIPTAVLLVAAASRALSSRARRS